MGEKKSQNDIEFDDLSAALDALQAAFVIYDVDERLVICNDSYRRAYHPCEDAVRPGITHTELQWLKVRKGLDANAVSRANEFVREEQIRHREGPELEEWQSDDGSYTRLLRARLPNGSVVGIRFDITDLRVAQNELERQNAKLEEARRTLFRLANTDELTGLTNRRAATIAMQAMGEACADKTKTMAIVEIDLDGFKQVNDVQGHEAGDKVLSEVAERLRDLVPEGCIIARVGGDEFRLALHCRPNDPKVVSLARKIVLTLGQPYYHKEWRCLIGASVGIAFGSGADLTLDGLVKSADMALYKSKRDGRGRVSVFDRELSHETLMRANLGRELLADQMSEQIVTYLQPIVCARTHQIVSAEALIRWQHPKMGIVGPGQFMQVAEDLRLSSRFDSIVLEQILAWRERWIAQGFVPPPISVNVSSQRLRDPDLLASLAKLDIPADAICFEILETVFSHRDDRVLTWNLDGLHEMGIELQIDDYGTAHSSISGLLLIRPQRLKIDRQFSATVLDSKESHNIVELTVALAHALGIQVTAEGVETQEQAETLSALSCDRLQGYLFAKPCAAKDFPALLDGYQKRLA